MEFQLHQANHLDHFFVFLHVPSPNSDPHLLHLETLRGGQHRGCPEIVRQSKGGPIAHSGDRKLEKFGQQPVARQKKGWKGRGLLLFLLLCVFFFLGGFWVKKSKKHLPPVG